MKKGDVSNVKKQCEFATRISATVRKQENGASFSNLALPSKTSLLQVYKKSVDLDLGADLMKNALREDGKEEIVITVHVHRVCNNFTK